MALNSNFRTLTADNIEGIVEDRNYLKSSFENGTITGWTEVSVALTSGLPTGTPTISSTAASSLALSATSVTPLSGSRSLLVDVPSALTAGHGFISDEFTLDRMDLGKVLTVSFDYERVTGTYNFSGTLGSQTWMVYVYDATAGGATWIQPAGFLGMNQSSGPGRVSCTFQSSVTAGQKYRVAVIASQAAAGASSIEFDNFSCSRQTAPIGPVVTDWVSYTSTITNLSAGTASSQFYRWRRVGDSIQILGNVTAGGTGIGASGQVSFTIPSGLSFDTSKLAIISETTIGTGSIHDSGSARLPCSVNARDSTSFHLVVRSNAATGGNIVSNNEPSASWWNAAGDSISFELMAPISGWSSNVQLSNDTDTRVVDFRAYTTTARTVNNTAPTVIFENVDKDSHGAYNASTGVYTVPVSGDYVVSGQMRIGGLTMTAGAFFGFSASVDNVYSVRNHYTAFRAVTASSAGNYAEGSGSVLLTNLRAGQTIRVRGWGDNATATFTDGANTFCIQRISGPSVVAANQVIAFSAYDGGSVAVTNTTSLLPMGTTDIDTHAVRSGQTYVIPVSGFYRLSAKSTSRFSAGNAAFNHALLVYKNGAAQNGGDYGNADGINTSALEFFFLSLNSIFRLNAGDVIDFRYFTNYTGVATTYLKYCAVERLGGTG